MTQGVLTREGRTPTKNRIVCGLDMGTTKICAIVARVNDEEQIDILGVGTHTSLGLRKGIVIDVDDTANSVREAVRKAGEMASTPISEVFVGIAGGHIDCLNSHAMIEITDPDRGITARDMRRVLERAKALSIPIDRDIIHCIPQHFYVDDGVTHKPEKIRSTKLEVDVLIVTAAVTSAQNIIHAVHQAGLQTAGIFLQPLASAKAVLEEEMMQLGCILLDIGGGTTDIALFSEGAIKFTGVIPYGGDAITNDLHKGLGVSFEMAENIKRKYGCAIPSQVNSGDVIEVPGVMGKQVKTIEKRLVSEIIAARMEEIFDMARDKISSAPHSAPIYGGVILTGGAALLPRIEELAARVFDLPVEVRFPRGLKGLSGVLESPIYSTAVGLVEYGFQNPDAHDLPRRQKTMFNWLRRIFENLFSWY
ncbi:MAG: cell division protein FtsA [Candidatus Sumerlaeia bacterium]